MTVRCPPSDQIFKNNDTETIAVVDQTAVDKNGNPIYLDAQNPVRPRAVPTMSAVPATATSKEKRALVYGWDRVIWLARYEPDKVRRTPEAYMFFAMAVYYTQNNKYGLQFSSGYGLVPGANPFIP